MPTTIRWPCTAGLVLFVLALINSIVPAQSEKPKKVALLVGVNKYKHSAMKRLSFAEADVTDLAKELKAGGYDEVVTLTGADATRENILKKLDALRKVPGDGGVLLVALAGHGLQPSESSDAYFCPCDADQRVVPANDPNPGDPWDYKTMVPLSEVLARLKASSASTRVLLMDACRNDPSTSRGVGTGLKVGDLPDNTAVLLSCSRGQRSYEHKDFGAGHGAFFHHVLLGLREKGRDKKARVTADSLWEYVRDAVPETVATTLMGIEQKPFRVITGDVDLQLALRAGGTTALGGSKPMGGMPKEREVRDLSRLDSTKGGVKEAKEVKEIQTAWADALDLKLPVSVKVGGSTMEFVLVPPGAFLMGTQRHVTIDKPFLMSVCEVRQSEYAALIPQGKKKPAWFKKQAGGKEDSSLKDITSTDDFPVEQVPWDDAQEFASRLLPLCKAKVSSATAVRLPTDAEWEYAGRAGTTDPFQNDKQKLENTDANFADKKLRRPQPCGQFPANPLGLRDMHGNVAEWCYDGYEEKLGNFAVIDPVEVPKKFPAERVVRGGSWSSTAEDCKFDVRYGSRRDTPSNQIGFRVVIVLDPKK